MCILLEQKQGYLVKGWERPAIGPGAVSPRPVLATDSVGPRYWGYMGALTTAGCNVLQSLSSLIFKCSLKEIRHPIYSVGLHDPHVKGVLSHACKNFLLGKKHR